MKWMMAAGFVLGMAAPALADDDIMKVEAIGTVTEVADRLVSAVEGAGATVFARVDHAGGAASVDMELAPMELVIFGNPKLGTPALQDSALAGLALPLRVLVYEDGEGKVWLAYEDPEEMLEDVGVDEDLKALGMMEGALKKLTGAAANGE
ncbi:DUF302 domain-containing protein [Vannielia sp.]|uniref:DUF302 domain-containing protein n=1 Tax=Vannielia sp. TaxID=2813045 RepID=UPI0026393CBA|nr:DUF302 domain-containing protein [Vannielia sp.]MDF1873178.1 DUF302 domain-containing protein [Vannielia sp.]